MQIFRFRAGDVHTVMDWLALWLGDLDLVRVDVGPA